MKSTSKSSKVFERYGMIEALESRIAPAAVGNIQLPANPVFRTIVSGGGAGGIGVTSLLLKANEVLTTGSSSGGSYLLFVSAGEILVHVTDLNDNGQVEFNEITGISAGNGAVFTSFVDIHGDVVTDLNPDGTLSDNGKGDILLDNNIGEIDLRSLSASDFAGNSNESPTQMATDHLALSSYSIFGNIYAGGGLGLPNNANSGLHIDNSGIALQANKYTGATGTDFYQPSQPVIGSIYVGSSASGKAFSFGSSGSNADIFGNLLAFTPAPGEAGASIYNISSGAAGETFNIGTIHAGDGGFNGAGGSIVNVALQGDNAGTYQLIAGNAGNGTVGQSGGSIINFSETGAVISEVILQSGNGGTGLTGAGGNAGNITFSSAESSVQINAHFVLNYGNGGDGYTHGGAGGGTASANFITPNSTVTEPLNLVSTMHTIGSIGNTTPIDFNGDGISDAVFSTTSPNQVVVALGQYTANSPTSFNGEFGLNFSQYIYLNSPAMVDSIVVGDFTGNGHPDIAVATGSGSNAGIEVYLSQYNPKTGAFEGFSDPMFSPLPSLDQFGYYTTTATITKLVAGSFVNDPLTGHQVMDLAVLEQIAVAPSEGAVIDSVLIFMNGETNAAHPYGSGYFYANTKAGNEPYIDFGDKFSTIQSTFIASALQSYTPGSGSNDYLFYSGFNDTGFGIISDATGAPAFTGGGSGWGEVHPPGLRNPVQFYDYTFTVTQDPTTPNIADVIAVSQNPQAYMVTLQGNGTLGGFNITSGFAQGVDLGYGGVYEPVGIVAIPTQTLVNKAPVWSDFGVLDYDDAGGVGVHAYTITEGQNYNVVQYNYTGVFAPAGRSNTVAFGAYVPEPVTNINVTGSGSLGAGFLVANPLTADVDDQAIAVIQPYVNKTAPVGFTEYVATKNSGYFFNAGNGGNSQAGIGVNGGSFGESLTVATEQTTLGQTIVGTGTLQITFPEDISYDGLLNIVAGQGGNGFSKGGNGGNLFGISLQYATTELSGDALLFSGSGGQSLTGAGGAGGSEGQLYIESGQVFVAGDGGIGVIGGAGGSLLGDTQAGLVTAQSNNLDPIIILHAGSGATGITGGGNGGNITSWVNEFLPYTGGVGGVLNYVAGNAGSAVAGQGGTGGSVLNDSPASFDNNLVGDIYLQGGAGGNGYFGGAGGTISNFVQLSTINEIPTSTTFLAGAGGNGTLGTGGTGGSISGIAASSTGAGDLYTFNFGNAKFLTDALDALVTTTPISYNRMVAGPGGSSAGGVGGAGGSIGGPTGYAGSPFNIDTASAGANSQNVIVAGAGGTGLSGGGHGGSIANVTADAGSASGKVVIIAGDGGAATGAAANDPTSAYDVANAIGGVNGAGGAGGNISNFQQSLSTSTHVDLIAGNGGATPNHGTTVSSSAPAGYVTTDNSGVGGSITGVNVAGSIGNAIDPTVAIKSYNNILAGQTMQQFVNSYILGDPSGVMSDTVGNVGIVAGAAGRIYGGQGYPDGLPSANGINGSVANIYAENIMSMIAGNVDQVAQIQSLTNYNVTITGGILGSNKTASSHPGYVGVLGTLNYINAAGQLESGPNATPLPGGGELLDGAFVARNIRVLKSARDFEGTVI